MAEGRVERDEARKRSVLFVFQMQVRLGVSLLQLQSGAQGELVGLGVWLPQAIKTQC